MNLNKLIVFFKQVNQLMAVGRSELKNHLAQTNRIRGVGDGGSDREGDVRLSSSSF